MGVGGWEEKLRIRLNSAQFELNLPVGAELGNISRQNRSKDLAASEYEVSLSL